MRVLWLSVAALWLLACGAKSHVAGLEEGDDAGPVACGQVDCASNECCLLGCGGVDPGQACAVRPDVCLQIYSPVCGCDGRTYSNDCEAHGACVAIERQGACPE